MKKSDHYLTVGPIGCRNDTTTFFRNAKGVIKVKCGCFIGTIDAFLEKVTETHRNNKHAVAYRAAAALAVAQIDTTVTDDKPPKEHKIVKPEGPLVGLNAKVVIADESPFANNENNFNKEDKQMKIQFKVNRPLMPGDYILTLNPAHFHIKNVIFNDPATIVIWGDGTKTVVKCANEDYDPEKGLAMAIAKKVFGNEGNYYNVFKKWLSVKTEEIETEKLVEDILARIKVGLDKEEANETE